MTDLPPPATPPGWYPDGVAGQVRWWNGEQWTERVAPAAAAPPTADDGPLLVRGTTGYAELAGGHLLYRPKPDRPPLQRIDLHTVQALLVSKNGQTFDVALVGSRAANRTGSRPGLLSETSLRRDPRTPAADWQAFVTRLEAAVVAAVPKFAGGPGPV
ncbi:DUF2510 domain-containing protein [Frondihabitans cladoniiphilus]|uniref:DUF2510 domain-containing protein n=1 Tax=Frondihabitans cladoniiphilus TaxID=715785 RepID=A0ABP8VGU0_9MICO